MKVCVWLRRLWNSSRLGYASLVGKACAPSFRGTADSGKLSKTNLLRGIVDRNSEFASLLSNLDWQSEEQFINKILGQLNKELAETLDVFLKHDLSLGETAKELFIHRNTLNYRLDRITDLTGYNPRQVDGAVHCYLAIWLKKHGGREG